MEEDKTTQVGDGYNQRLTIYQVTTEGDCEGKSITTIGYATGDPSTIKQYFNDQKMYELRLNKIRVVDVTRESLTEKLDLKEEQEGLQKRLEEIQKELSVR